MTYEQAANWLLSRDHVLILTHKRPDGDTIGCAVALCLALRQLGKTAYVLENSEVTALYAPYVDGLVAPAQFTPHTVVSVDIAAVSLLPNNAKEYLTSGIHLAFDHHPSQEFFAQETCLDASRAACGELIYDVVRQWAPISPTIALPLYVAISTDTGCFLYGNTTGDTHRVAGALTDTGIDIRAINHRHFRMKSFVRLKLDSLLVAGIQLHQSGKLAIVSLPISTMEAVGATEDDVDDISNLASSIQDVTIGVTLRELRPDVWKLSLRTIPEELNASTVCSLMGGGGHSAASGATIEGTLDEVTAIILQSIAQVQSHG